MNMVTHAITMNGRIHGELKDRLDSAREIIKRRLELLDGTSRYALSLWRLPNDVPFDRVDLDRWPQEYIQAAGTRERMTVEVRRFEGVTPCQYVIGQGVPHEPAEAREVITWNGCEAHVHPSEIFDATEAADLLATYYLTDTIPEMYELRPLDV